MRNAGVAVVAVVISIFSVACGSARRGGSCSEAGFCAQDPQNAEARCRVGTWLDLPCRGPAGCTIASGTVSCDMSGDQAGDACASTAEAKSCAPRLARQVLGVPERSACAGQRLHHLHRLERAEVVCQQ